MMTMMTSIRAISVRTASVKSVHSTITAMTVP